MRSTSPTSGDNDDQFWQSTDEINTYEVFGRSLDNQVIVRDPSKGRDIIDISNNPGRTIWVPGMRLWAADEIWVGGRCDYLDAERLRSFDQYIESDVADDVFRAWLYDSQSDDLATIRAKQRAFWDWLDFDEIDRRAQEDRDSLADPTVEFYEPTDEDPRGYIIEWTDQIGRPTAKSKTVRRRTSIYQNDELVETKNERVHR